MNYIIPTILNIGEKGIDKEIELIVNLESKRGNILKSIIPIYYPICIKSFNYNYSFLIDCYSSKTYSLTYRVPDTILLNKLIKNIRYNRSLDFLVEVYSILKKYSVIRKWREDSILLDRIIYGRSVLDRLCRLLEYTTLSDLNGYVFKPDSFESIANYNSGLIEKVLIDINRALIDLDDLMIFLIRYGNVCEYKSSNVYDKRSKAWDRVYDTVSRVIDKNIHEIDVVLKNEIMVLDRKNSFQMRGFRQRLDWIEKRIKEYSSKLKTAKGDLKKTYKGYIDKLTSLKKSILKEMIDLEKKYKIRKEILEKKYRVIKIIEDQRKRFLLSEKKILSKEHNRFVNLKNLYLNRIIEKIHDMASKLDEYRARVLDFLVNTSISDQCVYIRCYIVYGSKNIKLYTPGYLAKKIGYRFVFEKHIRELIKNNVFINKLNRIDPSLLNKYDVLKK
ncbi:MAG: hypothetical protein QXX35_03970 [Desulfurococcaceae archaeon]